MNINQMFPSRFLKQEDVPNPTVGTIQKLTQEEIQDNGAKKMKMILHIAGLAKPMVLNKGNAETIAAFYGNDSDAWIGKSIEVFVDHSVMMQGKRVGGLRLRFPAQRPQPTASPIAAGHTTQNGFGNAAMWHISDGKKVIKNQTTEQVQNFLKDIEDSGQLLSAFKVKAVAGGDAKPADVWWGENQPAMADDPIPF